jgi:hypothetical protein
MRFAFIGLKIVLIYPDKKFCVFLLTYAGWFDNYVIRSLKNDNPTTGSGAFSLRSHFGEAGLCPGILKWERG